MSDLLVERNIADLDGPGEGDDGPVVVVTARDPGACVAVRGRV